MHSAILEELNDFRAGRRDSESYRISKKIRDRLRIAGFQITKDENKLRDLFEDLENLAYMRIAERWGWFRDSGLFDRAWGSRSTKIRPDLKKAVERIVRGDNDLKAFLVNVVLLEFCEECNGDPDGFWESILREIHEKTGKDRP